MDPREFIADLNLYRVYQEQIIACRQALIKNAAKKNQLGQVRTCTWSDEPKVKSVKGIDSKLVDLLDEERHINEVMRHYVFKVKRIDDFLEWLDGEPKEIVTLKYFKGKSWKELEEHFQYSHSALDKKIRKAIKEWNSTTF